MCNKFGSFSESTRGELTTLADNMNDVRSQISDLQAALNHSRSLYKQKINEFYRQFPDKQPFPTYGREIRDDIAQYYVLISYCLDAGDTELLNNWGIIPVGQNPCNYLVSNDFQKYCAACGVALERSKTELEENCWRMLIKMFSQMGVPSQPQAQTRTQRG